MREVTTKWILKYLYADKKRVYVNMSEEYCRRFEDSLNILDRIIIYDEACVHPYDL